MNRGAKYAAENAIRELATRPFVFSAHEVARLADLSRGAPAVDNALRISCLNQNIMFLGDLHAGASRGYFLGRNPALRWWCGYTLRLARLGINRLRPPQLQAAMALALDRRGWKALPANLLHLGRQTGMVADGGAPEALVFPWATLLQANPAGVEAYRLMFFHQSPPDGLRGLTLDTILDDLLAQLPEQQADIMRKRYGLDGARLTLAQLGAHYHVTRERIRQIQNNASRHIAQSPFQLALWWAFIADFMRGGCALLIPNSQLTPKRRFLYAMIRLDATPVPEFDAQIIGPANHVKDYRECLRRDRHEAADVDGRSAAADALPFLPARELQRLGDMEEQLREKRAGKNMPRMIVKALRSLGRAAHYTEITQTCNALFPDNQKSTRSWHNALSLYAKPGKEEFGIVWIGVKGVYGLKEHGYFRPAEGLYQSIPRIVREQFARTQRPVSFEAVVREVSKQRREFNHSSVKMALAFSDQIKKANHGYLPAPAAPAAAESKYDIPAALQAFTSSKRQENESEDE